LGKEAKFASLAEFEKHIKQTAPYAHDTASYFKTKGSVTISSSAPSGGEDGDIWLQYEA